MADPLVFRLRRLALAWGLTLAAAVAAPAWAADALPAADDPVLEARMLSITSELRCLVCQNQTVADSHAGLAEDLREQTREMLKRGATDDEVRAFMVARYGDFVLFRPPVKSSTILLWVGPMVLLLAGLLALGLLLRRRQRLPDAAFEADVEVEPVDTPDRAAPQSSPTRPA